MNGKFFAMHRRVIDGNFFLALVVIVNIPVVHLSFRG